MAGRQRVVYHGSRTLHGGEEFPDVSVADAPPEFDASSPEPSVIYSPDGTISKKKLENPAGFWNNVGHNTSSLFQNKGAFE